MNVWAVCPGHERGCPCLGCCIINDILNREAVASVRMSHDPEMQTFTLNSANEWPATRTLCSDDNEP